MNNLIKIFKKQGGFNLIKQYYYSGSLFAAIIQFLLLGRNKTALEILRLTTHFKTKSKLEKRYREELVVFDKEYDYTLPHEQSNKVWVCWLQGIENAPIIVQKCYKSLKENLKDKEIILITSNNISKYVEFPEFIIRKWNEGKITNTHLTDLLRLELLIKYGGMWVDSTVFCSGDNIPDYFFNSDLFFFQCLKPGRDGHSHINSSWLISSKSNNKILKAVQYLCYKYWNENDNMVDYFLMHDFMAMVLEYYPEEWKNIIPRDNATPHILLLRLFDKYDESIWRAIKSQVCFHKLTYKYDEDSISLKGTYYEKLFKEGDE